MELIDIMNSVIVFQSQTTLVRWSTFQLGSLTVIAIFLLFWVYLFLLTLIFVPQCLFSLCNSDCLVASVFTDFPSNQISDAPFHCISYDYCYADWHSLCVHLRDVPWEEGYL